jgi:predicted RNA-binding Zn ribbon-like protein
MARIDPTEDLAPAPVRLIRDFVNSREPQTGDEALTDPAALGAWCRDRGLLPPGAVLVAADLTTALAVREGLRAVLQAHAGHGAPGPSALDDVLARVPLRASFDGSGELRLRAVGDGAGAQLVAGLVDAVRRAGRDGSWDRLKVCARDSCRWAFYDTSRNRSGRWCSMAGCGNHVKMQRAYAARKSRERSASAGR